MKSFPKRQVVVGFAALLLSPIAAVPQTPAALPDREAFMTRRMPYDAFDRLPQHVVAVTGAKLNIAFAPGELDLDQDKIIAWVKRCAEIIGLYYGQYPVDAARILVIPMDGAGVQRGTSFGFRGAALKVYIGKGATEAQLDDDWVL